MPIIDRLEAPYTPCYNPNVLPQSVTAAIRDVVNGLYDGCYTWSSVEARVVQNFDGSSVSQDMSNLVWNALKLRQSHLVPGNYTKIDYRSWVAGNLSNLVQTGQISHAQALEMASQIADTSQPKRADIQVPRQNPETGDRAASKRFWDNAANQLAHRQEVYTALLEGRRVYRVEQGNASSDSLSEIARNLGLGLGNYPMLYKANPHLLGNADHIWPGMEIIVP